MSLQTSSGVGVSRLLPHEKLNVMEIHIALPLLVSQGSSHFMDNALKQEQAIG